MKKKSSSKSAFFNFRVLLFLCAAGALLVLAAFGARPGGSAKPQPSAQDQNGGLAQAQEADNNNVSPSGPGLVPGQRASSSSFTLMEASAGNGATVTTDKADYAPGETVVISGTGWTANQEVALHIDDSNVGPRWDASVIADGAGNISNSEFIIQPGDVGLAFTLTATQGAVTAWTQFTDVVGAGVAPNGDPGGFEIDGDLRAGTATPPGGTDWLDTTSVSGVGGLLFETGFPKDPAVTGPATGPHIDPANCGSACDDAFTGGSGGPNDNPSTTWFWQTGASNDKTDMNNAYFHISTSANGDRWITASSDRFSTNGTAYIDFELLQQTLTRNVQTGCVKPPCGNFTSDAPASTGGRTVNDLLVTAAYGNGGSVATLLVSQWRQVSPGVYQYVDVSGSIPAGSAFVATSLVPVPPGVPVPYGAFNVTPGVYSPNQFVEFSIDLTALLNVIGDPCLGIRIKTLMVKTKTSTTVTATLTDMLPPFQVSFGVGLTVTGSKTDPACPSDTGTVTATWSGGTGPFECKLDDGGTYAPCTSPKSYDVAAGSTHTIFVKDTGNSNCVKDTGPLTVGAGCTTAPSIGGQGSNGTVECPANPTFTAPTASDNCAGGALTPTDLGDTTSGNSCSLTHTKSWRATDACGNTSGTVSQTIIVVDTTPPTIGGQGSNGTVECPASPTFTAPTTSDTCGTSTVQDLGATTTAGTCGNTYSSTKSWKATDNCGNTSGTVSQTIMVVDTTPPTIGGQGSNGTVECPASPTFTAPTTSDTCGTSTVQDLGATTTAGTCGNTYSSTKSWKATDNCGNTSGTVSQTIMVVDTTPPTIGGQGSNGTVECPASPTFTAPTTSDTCGTSTVQDLGATTTAGTCANTYSSTKSWKATDNCGNTSGTVSQTIMVVDTTPPTIGGQGSNGTVECPASPTFTAPTTSDTCGTSTVQDLGATTTAGTCANTYSSTKSWKATDDCGNTSGTVSQTIMVVDTTPPTIGGQGSNGTVECPASPTFTAPTTSDTCGTSTVQDLGATTTAGTCANTYSSTKSWKATDDCGNTSGTVSQTIMVVDTTPPTIGGQGSNGTVECPASPTFTAPTTSDTCGTSTVQDLGATTTAGTCGNTYSSTKSWKATDNCGNTSGTVSQTIMVVDTTPPTIGGQGSNGTVECPASPTFTAPTTSDTCGTSTVQDLGATTTAGTCANTYSSTKSWKATDDCGNTSGTVSQTIMVVDTTPPTIGGQGDNTTIACDGTPVFTPPTASDACGTSTVQLVSDTTTTHGDNTIYTRCWNAVDACSNTSATVCQTITRPACAVSQITPTGTTCTQFVNGTAPTLSSLSYKVRNGVIQQVAPGVFFYWVAVTVPAGQQCVTITQTSDHNPTPLFDVASGSNVFNSNCNSQHPTITQDPTTGAVTACWNATTAGTYIISIKYNASSITGDPAPSPPTTVQYTFTTTGVPGSNQGLKLVRSN